MRPGWSDATLGDFAQVTTGFPFKSTGYVRTGLRLLRGKNVGQGCLDWQDLKSWPLEGTEGLEDYALAVNDVILAMDRPWIEAGLKYATVSVDDVPCLLVQRVARIRAGPRLDQVFLRFLVASRPFTEHILAVQTGSTIPHISKAQIEEFRFDCPPLDEQRRIAEILGAFDDKIELNRKMTRTLEAMAQALFKSWFVDFDGHDDLVDSELGPVPRGWRIRTIEDVVDGVFDGPHATPPPSDSGPIFLGIRNLTGTNLDFSSVRRISEKDWPRWTKRVEPTDGDIVFSYEARLGDFALIPPGLKCCLGRRLALIRPECSGNNRHYLFHYFTSRPFQEYLRSHVQPGSTVDRILLKNFPGYPILLPEDTALEHFERAARSFWRRIHAGALQSRTLSEIRDTLLPELVSGEIRVPKVEKMAEAVL